MLAQPGAVLIVGLRLAPLSQAPLLCARRQSSARRYEADVIGERRDDHRCGPAALPWHEPVGRCRRLIGLYFGSRELHSSAVVHESSRRPTCSAGEVLTCRRTVRAAWRRAAPPGRAVPTGQGSPAPSQATSARRGSCRARAGSDHTRWPTRASASASAGSNRQRRNPRKNPRHRRTPPSGRVPR